MRMSIIAEKGCSRDGNGISTKRCLRKSSVTQYFFFQKKISTPSLDEVALERNGGGCKLNTWCDGQAMSSIITLVASARSLENDWPPRHDLRILWGIRIHLLTSGYDFCIEDLVYP